MRTWLALVSVSACLAVQTTTAEKTKLTDLVVTHVSGPESCSRPARVGDDLRVHYVGRLEDKDGKVFDASRDRGNTFNFKLGAGQVIEGYERGVPGMCRGATRTLHVPAHMGYGERGVPGVIPPDSTLHFTVELVTIEGEKREKTKDEV